MLKISQLPMKAPEIMDILVGISSSAHASELYVQEAQKDKAKAIARRSVTPT